SGKSNLIKAFAFVRNFVLNGLQQSLTGGIPVEPFLLSTTTETKPSTFELEILSGDSTYIYGFEVFAHKVHKEWLQQYPNKKVLFERTDQDIKANARYFKEGSANAIKNTRENVLFLTVLASLNGDISKEVVNSIKKIQVLSKFDETLNYSFDKYTKDASYRQKMKDFILQADFGIRDLLSEEKQLTKEEFVKPVPPQFQDILTAGKDNFFERKLATLHPRYDANQKEVGQVAFNFFKESEGTQKAFALSAPFINSLEEGNLLVVDELDSSLHPLICRYLLKLFNSNEANSNQAQLVFTTHDISLLDEDLLRRDQIWFTQKDKFGATELFSLADLGERSNLNFAKRYLEGRYGALPYIKELETIE
ncbi:ATP-binding protein, partial [Patescibacteria group bacterium]|nr:ATP-binding protein [Patescibacteria group bacterium]